MGAKYVVNSSSESFQQDLTEALAATGATIAFAALLLIIPGFVTDVIGFLLIFPITRKLLFGKILRKSKNKENLKKDYIEGDFEDIEDDNDRKI